MRSILASVLVWLCAVAALAQTATVRLEVRSDERPVRDATVTINGRVYETNSRGIVEVTLPPGHVEIVVVKEGFAPASATVDVTANQEQPVLITLTRGASVEEHVTVSATRTDQRVEDVPMRVDVLDAEEVREETMQAPGDVVNILREMGGLHVTTSGPSLGAAGVRIQGMRSRYTRVLADGLPLFGAQVGSLGLLQIPPMDLAQVELIKGVASALYGAGAIGGVVNLIARRPSQASQELLVNRSSRGETDATAFLAAPLSSTWGGSLLVGGHDQTRNDIDGDGWADLAAYRRGEVRPRLYWDDQHGSSFFATTGVSLETRTGGTTDGAVLPATQQPYQERLDTQRYDVGLLAQTLLASTTVLAARFSGTWQSLDHAFGDVRERERHDLLFGEISARRAVGRQTLVIGTAIEQDTLTARDTPQFSYSFTTPGVFVQDDVTVVPWFSLSAGARLDVHNVYGTFVSPRVSALFRFAGWSSRASAGTGFFPTSVLTEETEAAGLSRLTVRGPLRAETGQSASVDLTRTVGPFSATATVYASRLAHAVYVDRTDAYVLSNQPVASTNIGGELLATWRREPLTVHAVYDVLRAREYEDTALAEVPLTPRQTFTFVAALEDEDSGRLVFEWFYTGKQRLEANPFRTESAPYTTVGLMGEWVIKKVRLFVNGENLTDVRQTRYDPLLRPGRGVDGQWTVDAWAPLDGRNINGGIRLRF
jgi:iron complex outermembrane receptor protein